MRLANISNGLAYPYDDVCYFQSTYGHHASLGYFRLDSMPYSAVIHLLLGGTVTVVDASAHRRLSDALRWGVTTWCLVFNRALGVCVPVCDWETPAMRRVAHYHHPHRKLMGTVRKLERVYGNSGPLVVGENVLLECHRRSDLDDRPDVLRGVVAA